MALQLFKHRIPFPTFSLSTYTVTAQAYTSLPQSLVITSQIWRPKTVAGPPGIRWFQSTATPQYKITIAPSIIPHISPPCFHMRPSISPIAASAARSFHSSPRHGDHHFDTLKLVERLQQEGFTEEQSVAMMNVLSDIIEESVQNLTRSMVPQAEQEKTTYAQKVAFSQLRSDIQTHHNTEYQATRAEYERLSSEIAKLNSRLREEIIRAQNSVKLDLNLEKGRIREEASVHELKIKETDTRIETEVGMIRGTLEAVKFSTLQWLIGVCTGTAALILGVWRLLS